MFKAPQQDRLIFPFEFAVFLNTVVNMCCLKCFFVFLWCFLERKAGAPSHTKKHLWMRRGSLAVLLALGAVT